MSPQPVAEYRRDCPAPRHDTQTAAEEAGCICPKALALLNERKARKRGHHHERVRVRRIRSNRDRHDRGRPVPGVTYVLPDHTPEQPMARHYASQAELTVRHHAAEHGVPCQDRDPELWFPLSPDSPYDREVIALSKAYCRRCPVQAACAEWGMRNQYGTFGGLTEWERRRLRERPSTRARSTQ